MKLRSVLGLAVASSALVGGCFSGSSKGVKAAGKWHGEIIDVMEFMQTRDYYQSLAPSYIAGHRAWQLEAMMSDTRYHGVRSTDEYKWDWAKWDQIYQPVYAAAKAESQVHCDAHRDNSCARLGLTTTPDPGLAGRLWQAGDVPRAAAAFALACKQHPDDGFACDSARAAIRKLIDDNAPALGGKSFATSGPLADHIASSLIQHGYRRAADPDDADFTLTFDDTAESTYDIDSSETTYEHTETTYENVTSPRQKDLAYKLEFAKGKLQHEDDWLRVNFDRNDGEWQGHRVQQQQFLDEVRAIENSLSFEAPDRKPIYTPIPIPATLKTLSGSGPCTGTVVVRGGHSFTADHQCKFSVSWVEHDGDPDHDLAPRRGPQDVDAYARSLYTSAQIRAAFTELNKAFPDYDPGLFKAWTYNVAPGPDELGILLLKWLISADDKGAYIQHAPFAITARFVRDECNLPDDIDPGELLSEILPPEQR